MNTLTSVLVKTPALDGMLYTVRMTLNDTPIGVYQAVTPEVYETPFTSMEDAIYMDVPPSAHNSMKIAPELVAEGISHGFPQEVMQPLLLMHIEHIVRDMEGVRHIPVLNDPFCRIRQYQISDTRWQSLWVELKARLF